MHATRRTVHSALIQLARTRRNPTSSSLLRQISATRGVLPTRIGSGVGSAGGPGGSGVRCLSGSSGRGGLKSDDSERRSTQQKGDGSGAGSGGRGGDGKEPGVDVEGSSSSGGGITSSKGIVDTTTTTAATTSATDSTSVAAAVEPQLQPLEETPATEQSAAADKSRQQQSQPQREGKPRGRPLGSSKRRIVASKPKDKDEGLRPEVPEWFMENNVLLVEQNLVRDTTLECWIVPKQGESGGATEGSVLATIEASAQDGAAEASTEVPPAAEEVLDVSATGEVAEVATTEETTEVTAVTEKTEVSAIIETRSAVETETAIVTETEVESTITSGSAISLPLELEESPILDRAALPESEKVLVVSLPVNKASYIDANLNGSIDDITRAGKLTLLTPTGVPITDADADSTPSTAAAPGSPETPEPIAEPEKTPSVAGSESVEEVLDRLLKESSERGAVKGTKYATHIYVWREIIANVQAGLALPKPSFHDSAVALKSHLVLKCPRDGGLYHLDTIVEHVAALARADIVKIDAQDLEEIAGDYLGDSKYFSLSTISSQAIRSLGYDAQLQNNSPPKEEPDEEQEEEEESEDAEEEPETESFSIPTQSSPLQIRQVSANGLRAALVMLPDGVNPGMNIGGHRPTPLETLDSDRKNERKVAALLDALIGSASAKRARMGVPAFHDPWAIKSVSFTADLKAETLTITSPQTSQPKTIIHIQDYSELQRTSQGATILKMMHELVAKRRKAGESILILGTTASDESADSLQQRSVQSMQELQDDSLERTILVPPMENLDMYEYDRKARVREVNIRHLRDVIRRRSGSGRDSIELQIPKDWHYLTTVSEDPGIPGIDEDVWTFDKTHRIANMAIGQYHKSFVSHISDVAEKKYVAGQLTVDNIISAVEAIEQSDEFKQEWVLHERKRLLAKEKEEEEASSGESVEGEDGVKAKAPGSSVIGTSELLRKLNKTCNAHEKKLLAGVINPDKLHVGFNSIRAPPETIESLRTLTSLSLVRPDAFRYGVLATDRIPGVLLYGPPGTGKTLLAKAVAKESGATVLEVSGSEIFDMYVGEGEKNVKAIFSLAQKLSPCIVFIDEADAIFGARNSNSSRNTHREIINQFLKEWADFAHSSAFIMVATNRPFDLDDAVLRRLPRRILVDLPTSVDRLEILKIHLKDEILDADVDLQKLADRTPLYSGSDLKNICVAAALACVREEKRDGEGRFPRRRRLGKIHFDKAVEEIGASVGEDMGSLSAIRKFDEKYGEGKGRSGKRSGGWGFGERPAVGKGEGDGGEGRVRKVKMLEK
ncbi:hypothetical protein DFH27DRAFT_631466 [Peziza echinospora]|nr:hypothetical protein DFH27DRAFT_631466 [Peziza echinospora]